MKLKKSALALLVLVFSTTACNVNIIPEKVSPISKLTKGYSDYTVTKVSDSEYIIDLAGKNKNRVTGNKVSVFVSDVNSQFKTKASTDGLAAQTASNVKSYLVNLCTDPTQPFNTRLLVDTPLNRNSADLTGLPIPNAHKFTFINLPPDPLNHYYATVQAFDQIAGTGTSIIKPDNGNTVTPYISPDTGLEIAVSSNYVTINADFTYTFSSGIELDITAYLKDSSPPTIDSTVEPFNGKYGFFSAPDVKIDQAPGGSNQSFPSVNINTNGNGLVVWKDERASTKSVYARFINDYTPDGNEFLIASRTDTSIGDIFNPNVSLYDNGNGFVVWSETIPDTLPSQPANHIYLKPISAYKLSALPQVSVDIGLTGNQQSQNTPKIALNSNVGLISWSGDSDASAVTTNKIYVRGLYSSTFWSTYNFGSAGSSTILNPTSAGQQINLSSSAVGSTFGNLMLVWQDSRSGNYDIYAEKLRVSGTGIVSTTTPEFIVNQSTSGNQESPAISVNDSGNGLVVWQDATSGNYNIYARKILAYATDSIEPEFVVTNAVGDQKNPSISLDSNGNGLITWEDGRTGVSGTSDLYGIQVKNFSIVGNEFKIDSDTTQKQQNSAVSVNSSSNGMVTWQDYRDYTSTPTIYARRVAGSITQ